VPTYDYACEYCGYEFELFQSITAKSIRKCPRCGERALKRLIGSGAGIIFKGAGFYQTDYRSESYKKAEKSEKGTVETSTAEKKTDTKDAKSSQKEKDAAGTKDKKKSA